MDRARLASQIRKLTIRRDLLAEAMLSGSFRSAFRGRGAEFAQLREYGLMDDARSIDWNVSARMGKPFARSYREERELSLFILMDGSASMACGAPGRTPLERAALCAALLAYAAQRNGDRAGFCSFSEEISFWLPLRGGRKHALAILDAAASQEGRGRASQMGRALEAVRSSLKKRGVVIVLSDFLCSGFLAQARSAAARHDLILVRLAGPLEAASLPDAGTFRVRDPETGQKRLLPLGSPAFRSSLAVQGEAALEEYRRASASPGVRSLDILPEDEPVSSLISFFGQREAGRPHLMRSEGARR